MGAPGYGQPAYPAPRYAHGHYPHHHGCQTGGYLYTLPESIKTKLRWKWKYGPYFKVGKRKYLTQRENGTWHYKSGSHLKHRLQQGCPVPAPLPPSITKKGKWKWKYGPYYRRKTQKYLQQ